MSYLAISSSSAMPSQYVQLESFLFESLSSTAGEMDIASSSSQNHWYTAVGYLTEIRWTSLHCTTVTIKYQDTAWPQQNLILVLQYSPLTESIEDKRIPVSIPSMFVTAWQPRSGDLLEEQSRTLPHLLFIPMGFSNSCNMPDQLLLSPQGLLYTRKRLDGVS